TSAESRGAGLWLGATEAFLLIENLTGYCFDPVPEGILVNGLPDKWTCLHKGHKWHGYDVSDHTFLLTFCCLLMVEETAIFRRYLAQGHPAGVPLRLIFLLNVLLLWNFLLASVDFSAQNPLSRPACLPACLRNSGS
ncbi:fat storage-inducing transmembrane protein 1-like, partial [Ahaetulla prasina]|uniref:fat storage-inducing transmembrane protein 1-like n=1 Tax=Ahaetulla prasina TaxID=499056 RepID=UPI0026484325